MSEQTYEALVKAGPSPEDTAVVTVSRAAPAPGEVTVRVEACGVCGSDVHAWRGDDGYGWLPTPVVLGHEVVGIVEAVSAGVDDRWVGRRVVPISILGCLDCEVCRAGLNQVCPDRQALGLSFDGGCADYLLVAAERLVEVSSEAPADRMVLTEAMSVAGRAVRHLGEIPRGSRVVVSGPGPIGLFAAWELKRRGVDVVLLGVAQDQEARLPAAAALGIPTALADTDGQVPEADLWIEASGSGRALTLAIASLRPGGTVVVVAIFAQPFTTDLNEIVRREIKVVGSYGSQREDYVHAADVLASSPGVEDVLSTVFPLAKAVDALSAAAAGDVVKAVIVP